MELKEVFLFMKKVSKKVQRIESHYVGDDCIQIQIPYKNSITLLNQDGILFHSKQGSNFYINKYLEDERRKKFPYSNIPISYSRVGMKKTAYTNQLLEFEKPYIQIGDNYMFERFVVKDNNQALLVKSIMDVDEYTKHMTYDELLKFIEKNDTDEQTYYVYLDGSIPLNENDIYPSEEEIYNYIHAKLEKNIEAFRGHQQKSTDVISRYLRENPWFLNYAEQSIKNLDLSLIDFNIKIGKNTTLLIVRINKGNITIQGVNVFFLRQNDFRVNIQDILVTKYTLEQLKYVPKINTAKDLKIPLKLNPGLTKQDIQEAKQMIKSLRKQ